MKNTTDITHTYKIHPIGFVETTLTEQLFEAVSSTDMVRRRNELKVLQQRIRKTQSKIRIRSA